MATTQTNTTVPSFDAAYEQLTDINEQFLGAARKAGNIYVDAYEKPWTARSSSSSKSPARRSTSGSKA
jgi:hypothetical protein